MNPLWCKECDHEAEFICMECNYCPDCCMCVRSCSICNEPMVDAPCDEKPELLIGAPIGMYHCPDCGEMQMAGIPHLPICPSCHEKATGRKLGETKTMNATTTSQAESLETEATEVASTETTVDGTPESSEEAPAKTTPEDEPTPPEAVEEEVTPDAVDAETTEAPADATEQVVTAEGNGVVRAVSTQVRLNVARFRTAFLGENTQGARGSYIESIRRAIKFYGSKVDATDEDAVLAQGERIVLENVISL